MNRTMLLGLGVAAVLGTMGAKGFTTLRDKARLQENATEVVQRWKQSYKALAAFNGAWTKRYPAAADYADLLDVYNSLRLSSYGLVSNPDKLGVTRHEPVQYNNSALGLVRVCIASDAINADSGLTVTASTHEQLLDGVRALSERAEVAIGGIKVKGGDGAPTAELQNFCLLLRETAA
ncbi:hypothetical protein AE923_08990 [Xanthomonas arboricola]|uniref:hypothetical protein n=1 Tax=Xanthomonas arboricola TaxID=56448 RepID=UPI00069D2DC4|nr:hypothetical protein [Xanthomonas arboricola]KOB09338.1 hypothetical protein AE923_08990 [Xanthomonas arboricola]